MPRYCANSKANCANAGTPWTSDIGDTRQYRPDCSGFVDMAWHLNADPNTDSLPGSATRIAIKDLQPGDLLDNIGDGHAVLFEKWVDSAHTKLWYFAETHPGASMEHERGSLSSTVAGWPAGHYTAYQYKKIQGGDPPPTQKETTLAYTGLDFVANGSVAKLSAKLTEKAGKVVANRSVDLAVGAQTCKGTTDADGQASCTIDDVKQTLTDDATVPVTANFAADDAYNASKTSATVKLQYVTGRAFGLSADIPLLGTPIAIKPTPDTGVVRTADAATNAPPCAQNISALLLSAGTLCGKVVAQTGIGLVGLPVIGLSGVKSTATGTCTAQTGAVDLTLTVAGTPIHVGDTPNLKVDLGILGTKLVVDEQTKNADGSLTVNAAHLTGPGGIDIVVASSTAAAHNCA